MRSKQLLAAAVTAALSTGVVVSGMVPVFAADTPPKTTEASATEKAANETAQMDFVKVSDDALMTMRDVRAARLAIFSGFPEKARTHVDAAVTRVAVALKDAAKYAVDTKAPKMDDSYIPFDASLTVLDTFVPSAENAKHIAKANEHLHKGEKKEALDVLRLGEIDVAVTAGLIPVKLAKQHIDEAAKLLGEGKYYEANLALKAVEDSAVVETFAIDAEPEAKANAKAEVTSEGKAEATSDAKAKGE
jgi:hypothetical protein